MTKRTVDDCINDIVNASGLEKRDVKQIASLLGQKASELRAQGLTDVQVADQIRQIGALSAKNLRITAALKRKQAAINARVLRERHKQIDDLVARGVGLNKAIRAILVGDNSQLVGSKNSIAGVRRAYEADWVTGLYADIHAEMPHVVSMLKARKRDLARKVVRGEAARTKADDLMDDVAREMREPGRTGNKEAMRIAQIFKEKAEQVRQDLNRLGANIGKLDDWGGPQSHDSLKVQRAKFEKWAPFILERLDVKRTFGDGATDDEIQAFLRKAYDNIVIESPIKDGADADGRLGPANLARGLESERVFHFKSADDWLAYNKEFGRSGGMLEAMQGHFAEAARKASLMHHLGPNPENMLNRLIDERIKRIEGDASLTTDQKRDLVQELKDDRGLSQSHIGLAWAEVSGANNSPYSVGWARFGSNTRAVQGMAKLGGAAITALNDVVTYGARMNRHGRGFLPGIGDSFQHMMERIPAEDKRAVALALDAGNDGLLGDVASRFMPEDQTTGRMQAATQAFFRLSGLTAWTDMNTASFARSMSAYMAARAGDAFADLGKFGEVLKIYDIGPDDWAHVAKATQKIGDHVYFLPEKLRDVDPEGLPSFAETRSRISAELAEKRAEAYEKQRTRLKSDAAIARLDAKFAERAEREEARALNEAREAGERQRRDLELKFRLAIASEAETAIVEAGDETRMYTRAGTRPGTALGELARFMAQFKTFPIAFTQKVLNPSIQAARRSDDGAMSDLAQLIAYSTIAGYVSMTAKDFVANRTPKDPTSPKTLLAAMLKGGGAGLYGDFLFANSNKYGNSFTETLVGPAIGELGTATGLVGDLARGEARASDAFHFTLGNTPYANLWFLRGALDLAILNAMQETMSPGTFRRRERRMEKDFGQSYIVDPV